MPSATGMLGAADRLSHDLAGGMEDIVHPFASRRSRSNARLLLLVSVAAIVLTACGGSTAPSQPPVGGASAPATPAGGGGATPAPATPAPATPPPAGGITDPSKLITSDEAAAVLGKAVASTEPAVLDVYAGPLNGFGFKVDPSTSLAVGIITPATATTACAPAMSPCPTWDAIKSSQPGGAIAIPGVGDDAFSASQGPGIYLVGAKKGDTEVFMYACCNATSAMLEAMKALLATAVSRL